MNERVTDGHFAKASSQNGYEGRECGLVIGEGMKALRRSLFLLAVYMASILVMATPTQAQISVPAVDLQCLSPNPSGAVDVPVYPGATLTGFANCRVTNPNSYAERIQIQVSADGLVVAAPGTISLGPNAESEFQTTVRADQRMTPGIRVLNITASVVEANGAPPPNDAKDHVEGEIWIINNDTMSNTSIEITEIGPFKSSISSFITENGSDYPVLYLKESYHIDAIMTGWNETPIANKCLNLYFDPLENNIPVITVTTSENGTIEWFSGDPEQNPTLRGVETTGGKLEGLRTIRLAYEPQGGITSGCEADSSGNLSSSYNDIEVLVRSRTDLQLRQKWGYIDADRVDADGDGLHDSVEEYGTRDGDAVTGEVVLLRDRLDLAVVDENIMFKFDYYSESEESWIFDHEELYLTDFQGIASLNWSAKYISNDDCSGVSCHLKWRITALYPGSEHFSPALGNITFELVVLPPIVDSDEDGVEDDVDAFPNDPSETHDDDGDGVGNNTDAFPKDPDEQYDDDGDGVGNNADDFPDNKYASNWSTVYAAFGSLLVLLILGGVMISRMKKENELSNVPANNEIQQLEKHREELEQKRSEIIAQQDPTELMFED